MEEALTSPHAMKMEGKGMWFALGIHTFKVAWFRFWRE